MGFDTKVTLVFTNKDGDKKEVESTLKGLLEGYTDDFYEALEDDYCTSSSCNTESQNFCDCGPQYEDYELTDIIL